MTQSAAFLPADGLSAHDFMTDGVVWHSANFPWFNVSIRTEGDVINSLMVPSLGHLKKILALRVGNLHVDSIEYVTPGFMNGSGQWRMETLIEVTELFNSFGWSITRCRVADNRVYRGIRLEESDEWAIEKRVYSAG
jgi:hypothetical protein